MGGEQFIRAAVTKDFLTAVESVGSSERDAMARALDAETLQSIRETIGIGWLSFAHHAALNRAAREVLGEAGFVEAWRRAMLRTFDQPILRPVVQGGVRLFGLSPRTFVRLAPKAWELLSRHAGELVASFEREANEAQIELRDFAPTHDADGVFMRGMVGVFDAFFEATQTRGQVALVEHRPADGYARYAFTWS